MLWEQRHRLCRLSVLPHLACTYCLTGKLRGTSWNTGRQVCTFVHVALRCLLPWWPPECPYTAQCDIFNKVWGLWLCCLVWLWRCELFSDVSLGLSFVSATRENPAAYVGRLTALLLQSNVTYPNRGVTATDQERWVCKSEYMCLLLCLCACANVYIYHSMTHKPHQRICCRKLRQHSFKEEASTDKAERGTGPTHTHTITRTQICMNIYSRTHTTLWTVAGNPLLFTWMK